MFELYFGKAKWPIVVLLCFVVVAIAAYSINNRNNTADVQKQIVNACASASDQVACAKGLTTEVKSVK